MNTGNMYRKTSFRNGGRRAGYGMSHDNYGDESGQWKHEDPMIFDRVRFPHDDMKPEELNGPVICYKAKDKEE